jgi:hypothetical protein
VRGVGGVGGVRGVGGVCRLVLVLMYAPTSTVINSLPCMGMCSMSQGSNP